MHLLGLLARGMHRFNRRSYLIVVIVGAAVVFDVVRDVAVTILADVSSVFAM